MVTCSATRPGSGETARYEPSCSRGSGNLRQNSDAAGSGLIGMQETIDQRRGSSQAGGKLTLIHTGALGVVFMMQTSIACRRLNEHGPGPVSICFGLVQGAARRRNIRDPAHLKNGERYAPYHQRDSRRQQERLPPNETQEHADDGNSQGNANDSSHIVRQRNRTSFFCRARMLHLSPLLCGCIQAESGNA